MSMLATAVVLPCTQYCLGYTDEHIFNLLLKYRYIMCACACERCAMLADKWAVLDTAIGIKEHPLISQHSAPLADASTYLESTFYKKCQNLLIGASRTVLGAWSRNCHGQHTHVPCVNSACTLTPKNWCHGSLNIFRCFFRIFFFLFGLRNYIF